MSRAGESRRKRAEGNVLKAFGAAAARTVAGGVIRPGEAKATHGVVNGTGDHHFRPGVHGYNPAQGGVGVEGSLSVDGIGVWGRGGCFVVQSTGVVLPVLLGAPHSCLNFVAASLDPP
jgi:hypothetical protein